MQGKNRLNLNAVEMIRRPGSERIIRCEVRPSELDLSDDRLEPGSDIRVDLAAESLSDGIVVHGRMSATFRGECRRCLIPVVGVVEAEVRELYQVSITDPDAFPIEGDVVDLAPMIRETVLLELPDAPLCRQDCAGLCARCGRDLNQAPCSCPADSADPRWAALDALRGQLPE